MFGAEIWKTKSELFIWKFSIFGVESFNIQYNLNGSNTDGSFPVDDLNWFFSPYKILPIARENKYLGNFSYFIMALYGVYSLESPVNRCVENRKDFPKLSPFASWTGAMINPQWLELPMSRTNFHGPKDVWATEVRLYLNRHVFVMCTLKIMTENLPSVCSL